MPHNDRILAPVIGALLALSACGGGAVEPTATGLANTGGEGEATAPAFTDLDQFQAHLYDLLGTPNRDDAAIQATMGAPFTISLWKSEGSEFAPADAVQQLEANYLSTEAGVGEFVYPVDWAALTGEDVPAMFPDAARLIFSWCWGPYCDDEVILVIKGDAAQGYHWDGLVVARGGFAPATGGLEDLGQAVTQAILNRDAEMMAILMDDPFTFARWQGESTQMTPAEAAAELTNNWLQPGNTIVFDRPDVDVLISMLGGADPLTMWGPDANIVDVLHTQGWGPDGQAEALLFFSGKPDGSYTWYGVLVAPNRFIGG